LATVAAMGFSGAVAGQAHFVMAGTSVQAIDDHPCDS
jgi:hypothetical protein